MIDYTEPWYATREQVRDALDFKVTARADARIDRALAAASRAVDALCHRRFYPVVDTRSWDWPNGQYAAAWRLYLDDSELIELTGLVAGGVTIPTDAVILQPNRSGPPYRWLEVDLSTSYALQAGDTEQNAIVPTGLWGYRNTESPAATAAGAIDSAATTLTVSDASAVGVGSVLRVGGERLLVVGRSMADTGLTLQQDVQASAAAVVLNVGDGAAVHEGEVLLLDGERVQVVDTAGTNAVVHRQWDGSPLAAHAAGTPVYAQRALQVTRGALGTTASVIADGAALMRWDPPELVQTLTIAEAVTTLSQEPAGYARVARGASGASGSAARPAQPTISDIRDQCYAAHGRTARTRAV
ncbi:hypothetical protein VSR01_10745 [Actinacidiphila sp. DG2A-62]|uniref:hypothetical protein n=1 Tax=Actinacidiphila sp. DG2A-62 TaxID=3108821 RepID=UPI002DBAB62B|nr:hypothetical protein [Actinacidiphila sp. DG2A-62]MEC3993996.1 hypothetical protein [Actinacidiphila sp. DG2A-62]